MNETLKTQVPTLKQVFKEYGTYKPQEKCVYLCSNDSLQDPKFVALCKEYKIKVQLDLFS